MKLLRRLTALTFLSTVSALEAQQVNDPGVRFDQSKFDSNYPQMVEWTKAGVRGGIPLISSLKIKRTLSSGAKASAINSAINAVASEGGGAVLFKNGTYDINDEVKMKSGVSLVGESREGVQCIINPAMKANSGAFEFLSDTRNCGIYRMTIKGGWGTPRYDWNEGVDGNNELPGNENISVFFHRAEDCWIDDCDILNSADFPVRISSFHITVRNCRIDGVFNKHGGAHGYFFILDGYNLVTGCFITHLRHISLQGDDVRYNVVYDNDFEQEVSFHSGDDGDNLIENNRIHIPADMPNGSPDYFSIMGPWSSKHSISTRPNYIYKNDVIEHNHGGVRPWSDPDVVYFGPHYVRPSNPRTNFTPYSKGPPSGGTLYPIILGDPIDAESCSVAPQESTIMVGDRVALVSTVMPADATNQSVTWISENPEIAGVDASGEVTGLSPGISTISARTVDGGFTDESRITVIPSDRSTHELIPTDDAYLQGGSRFDAANLRVENGNRVSYLKFDLRGISGEISKVSLQLSVGSDAGNGQITIDKGDSNGWTEESLSTQNAPLPEGRLGSRSGAYSLGSSYTWDLDEAMIEAGGILTFIVTHVSGNDVSFVSSESTAGGRPLLTVSVPSSEIDQWLSSNGLFDLQGDEDKDGHKNQAEFWFGTDPRDASSYLTASLDLANGPGFRIVFASIPGRTYSVEATENLAGSWSEIRSGIAGTGDSIEVIDSDPKSRRFYRVTVEGS